jgi:hypothetical protein
MHNTSMDPSMGGGGLMVIMPDMDEAKNALVVNLARTVLWCAVFDFFLIFLFIIGG